MTYVFCSERLLRMPVEEARDLHDTLQGQVAEAAMAAGSDSLHFRGFELFPPERLNLLIARFKVPDALGHLRKTLWRTCRDRAVSFPDAMWVPHVALGKIKASRGQLSKMSCSRLSHLALGRPAQPLGLTLLGERPQGGTSCNWAFAFVPPPEVAGNESARAQNTSPTVAANAERAPPKPASPHQKPASPRPSSRNAASPRHSNRDTASPHHSNRDAPPRPSSRSGRPSSRGRPNNECGTPEESSRTPTGPLAGGVLPPRPPSGEHPQHGLEGVTPGAKGAGVAVAPPPPAPRPPAEPRKACRPAPPSARSASAQRSAMLS